MIDLHAIAIGIFTDLEPKLPDKQAIQCWHNWNDAPAVTISQLSDNRYALAKLFLDGICLKCELMLFTKWFQPTKELTIDICDPRSIDKLCQWIFVESLDGIRYGWNGKHNDSFRLRLFTKYARNPQPALYHQKSLPFFEQSD